MTAPARRGPGVLVVLLLAALAAVLLPAPDTPAARAATDALPVQVQLDRLEPKAPQPHDQIIAEGKLINTGAETVSRLRVVFDLGSYIGNRSLLSSWTGTPDGFIGVRLTQSQVEVDPGEIKPGTSVPFRVSVAADDLHLGRPGVYAFGIEARGRTNRRGYGTAGRLRVPLPWAPPGSIDTKSRLAWMWPLVDRPHRGASTVFRDDSLAEALADGGRLRGLLDVAVAAGTPSPPPQPPAPKPAPSPTKPAAKPAPGARPAGSPPPATAVPVTWVVDPLLLQDAATMAGGYRVRKPGSSALTDGGGAKAAQAWLADLRAALRTGDLMTLPYADVDINALVRAGLTTDVEHAIFAGADVATDVLGTATRIDSAWPADGYLTPDALQTLIGSGINDLVLRSDALPLDSDVTYTPTAHTTLAVPGGTVDVVLTDGPLDDTVADGARHPASARWAEQRFLAETLLFTEELPSTQRDLVVAPDRRWLPPGHYAQALLDDTARMPWLEPVTVSEVRATTPSDAPRDGLTYPARERRAELPQTYLHDVVAPGERISDLESIFVDPKAPLARELYLAGLRVESSAWRDSLGRARNLLDDVTAFVRSSYGKVRIVSSGLVTLTSSSGTIPITVANRLDQPVRVRLSVDAGGRARVTDSGRAQTLAAGQLTQLEIHMQAQTNGVFRVHAQLLTPAPNAEPYGPVQTLLVRSTAYGTVALGITGGALAVLFIAVAVRLTRRALGVRHSRHAKQGTE